MRKYLLLHVLIISFVFLLIIPLILLTLLPAVSLADADRIFKENSKAVVVVTAYDEKGNAISQGSGFIVRADGAVVTNYHVIGMARDIKITAGDRILDVEGLIFTDEKNDLVILKAKVKNMPVVKLGVVEKANIGEHVYVISSPEGLENTISDGLLSGIREIDEKREILQITAPISPGSSGGAVFNRNGEVIGVVTFLIKEAQNLNFAMPVELIKDKISSKMVTAIKGSGLEDYEKTVEYWFVIGTMYFNLGMNKEAIDAFKQAIKIDPDNADAHYNLGTAFIKSGMYKEAIEAYKQVIRIKPDYAEAHNNLGTAFIKSGMYKEAIEAYKQVIRIKPDYAEAHNNLGTAFIKSGMDKEAIEAYKQAIRINPDDANAHYYLGVIYALLNDKVSALEQYKILKSLDSELANKLFNLIYE
jgi:Tfp pilus assembly protein PilF